MGIFDGLGIDPLNSGIFGLMRNAGGMIADGASAALDMTPEAIARNAAARGVPPPPVDLKPQWADATGANFGGGGLGAALTGGGPVPMPQARPQPAGPGAPMDITSQAQQASMAQPQAPMGKANDLMSSLRGVTAPKAPETQRISSPSAPRPSVSIKSGDIIALLQGLQQQGGLPPSLGAALRR